MGHHSFFESIRKNAIYKGKKDRDSSRFSRDSHHVKYSMFLESLMFSNHIQFTMTMLINILNGPREQYIQYQDFPLKKILFCITYGKDEIYLNMSQFLNEAEHLSILVAKFTDSVCF